MTSEQMELSKEEIAEVVGARSYNCFVVAVACAGTAGAPEFDFAIVALFV